MRWEYLERLSLDNWELVDLGKEGWELAGYHVIEGRDEYSESHTTYYYIFKRELQEQPYTTAKDKIEPAPEDWGIENEGTLEQQCVALVARIVLEWNNRKIGESRSDLTNRLLDFIKSIREKDREEVLMDLHNANLFGVRWNSLSLSEKLRQQSDKDFENLIEKYSK